MNDPCKPILSLTMLPALATHSQALADADLGPTAGSLMTL